MQLSEISVPGSARSDMGWLDSLERSIESLGVLQPVGVDESGTLVFGARRVQACRNLGMVEVPAVTVAIDPEDPAGALKAERDENTVRKDFTPSEKVAIATAIEEAMGGRQGQRTDKHPQNLAEVQPGTESRDHAAEAVGWNRETYRQAKAVTESGDSEAVEAMDSGESSVNRAYKDVAKPAKTGPAKAPISVKLAYDVEPDANVIISKAGGKYATTLALKILELEGHEVSHD